MDTGHWICKFELDPSKFEGFVYSITHTETGKFYIGQKRFNSTRRKKVKCKGDPTKKKTSVIKTESNWKEYTGSSEELNGDILKLGKDKFTFEIISQHKMRGETNRAEALLQLKLCLTEDITIHDDTYNKQILLRIRK
jgi:hypothetical protein